VVNQHSTRHLGDSILLAAGVPVTPTLAVLPPRARRALSTILSAIACTKPTQRISGTASGVPYSSKGDAAPTSCWCAGWQRPKGVDSTSLSEHSVVVGTHNKPVTACVQGLKFTPALGPLLGSTHLGCTHRLQHHQLPAPTLWRCSQGAGSQSS
jgi:hypothetical protein